MVYEFIYLYETQILGTISLPRSLTYSFIAMSQQLQNVYELEIWNSFSKANVNPLNRWSNRELAKIHVGN